MTAYAGKGGEILECAVESALGTAGTFFAIRQEEGTDFPTVEKQLVQPSHQGRELWANTDDSPVTFESYQEGALKLGAYVRGGAAAADVPPLVKFLQSAGLSMQKTTSVNLDAYTSAVAFSADGAGGSAPGDCMALQSDDGRHWPFIVSNSPATSAYDFIPGYAVPGSVGTPASNDLYGGWCLTPRARQVPATATLGFRWLMRQQHTSYQMKFTASGCALAELPKVTLEPGKPIKLDLGFHVGDVALSDATYVHSDTTLDEQEQFVIWGGGGSQFAFANSNTAGAIAAGTVNLVKAEIDFAHKTIPIVGTGTTGTLNNCQGYMAVPGHATISLTVLCDAAFWTDISADTFQMKYIHFAQAGSTTLPFFGMFFPRCQQIENPKMVDKRGDYMQVELKYMASSAQWGDVIAGETDITSPWAIVLGRAVAA
jgi:hypothetical protein